MCSWLHTYLPTDVGSGDGQCHSSQKSGTGAWPAPPPLSAGSSCHLQHLHLLSCNTAASRPAVLAAGVAVAGNGDGYGMTDSHHFGQPSVTYRSNATASYGGQGAYGSDYPGYGGAPAAAQLQAPPRQQAAASTPGSPYGQRSPLSGGAAAGYGAPPAGELCWQTHSSRAACCMET